MSSAHPNEAFSWSPEALFARPMTVLPMATLVSSLELVQPFVDQDSVWREMGNKAQAIHFFRHAEILSGSVRNGSQLQRRLQATRHYRAFARPWLWEGLGWAYAERTWAPQRGPAPLPTPRTPWERGAQVALHPGFGMYCARRLTAPVASLPTTNGSNGAAWDKALETFYEICQRCSTSGYADACFEPLGLVVGLSFRQHLETVHRWLQRHAPRSTAYFWHGVGRGLYFAPYVGLAGADSLARALRRARRAHLGEVSSNLLSGLLWALCLVNFRHPSQMEVALPQVESREEAAWADGISSAAILWCLSIGAETHLEAWLTHRPRQELRQRWQRVVEMPIRRAVQDRLPSLHATQRYGEIFRHAG